jgi:hypothetical protein
MKQDPDLNFYSPAPKLTPTNPWVQYVILAATVLIVTIASYWGSTQTYILLIGLIVAIVGGLIIMRNPNISYLLIFIGGMFVPFAGPGGFNASILLIILMIVLWILDMFVVRREFKFVRSRTLRPALFFMLVSTISFGMGQISWFVFANQAPLDAQFGGFAIYLFSAATMVMTANLIKEIRWLKIMVWVFIGLAFIYVFGRALQLSFMDRIYQDGVTANSMFWTWLIAMALSQAIFNNDLKKRTRILLYGIVLVTFYVAMVQQSDWKSGWVPPAVVAASLVGLRFKRLTLIAMPIAFLIGVYLARDLISTDLYSWGTRVDAWLVVLDISRTSPLLGLGFANYYWYAKVFTIRGYHIKFNSHSQFVDIIAQTGIIGLLCFMWILFEVGALGWRQAQKLTDGFSRGYAYGVLTGVLGSLMAAFLVDWVLPFAYNIGLDGFRASVYPWIFFGGLVAIEQMNLENKIS